MLEVYLMTPDGHRLGQSVVLELGGSTYFSLGLETEEEARQRGELKGLFSLLARNDCEEGP